MITFVKHFGVVLKDALGLALVAGVFEALAGGDLLNLLVHWDDHVLAVLDVHRVGTGPHPGRVQRPSPILGIEEKDLESRDSQIPLLDRERHDIILLQPAVKMVPSTTSAKRNESGSGSTSSWSTTGRTWGYLVIVYRSSWVKFSFRSLPVPE